ncbi:hypothetical protein AK812_SmicGene42948 [Symbiodinium microadriaticum]|uniref:Uncharacterized protein n=1 Tax=Symbiodinium microadriaticum TaxID=2951 RepID=A0A1Q9C295_SYMMI|nr:hypothetical protein AK812_SmicGene42948 [Symbiodinium microadriaticum]
MCLLIRRDLLVATAVEFPLDHLFFVQPSVWSPRPLRCGRSGSDKCAVLVHKLVPIGTAGSPRRLPHMSVRDLMQCCPTTSGTLKSLLTACLCGVVCNSPSRVVPPLTTAEMPRYDRGITAVAALSVAERAKARTYPELAQGNRCRFFFTRTFSKPSKRLVALLIEVGGRWSPGAAEFVRLLARSRARAARCHAGSDPICVRLRWPALSAAWSCASSLLSLPLSGIANVDGEAPLLSDVLADSPEPPRIARHASVEGHSSAFA